MIKSIYLHIVLILVPNLHLGCRLSTKIGISTGSVSNEIRGHFLVNRRRTRSEDLTPTVGVDTEFPFPFVAQWYDYQKEFINNLDVLQYTEKPMYQDKATLRRVIPYERKEIIAEEAGFSLYGDRILIEWEGNTLNLPFDEVSAVTVLGRNKLNIYHDGNIYQAKGGKRFNALKYVHIYHRCLNIRKGDPHEQFLGL